jgi:protein KTI12
MALITITGYPSSGKSSRAQQLKLYLESRIADPSYDGPTLKVSVVSDDSLNISRDVYNGVLVSPFVLFVHAMKQLNR